MNEEFCRVFFKFYDKKTASGEVSFLRSGFNKAEFVAMCSGIDFEITEEKAIDYCEKLKLNEEESLELMKAAGFEK